MEINPDHPVTKELHEQWHKIAGILLAMLGVNEVCITQEHVDKLAAAGKGGMPYLIAHATAEGLIVRLVSEAEAMKVLNAGRA